MRRLLVLSAAVLAATSPAPLPAAAEGKKAVELPRREVWKAGDVVTRTKTTDQDTKVVVQVGGQVVQERPSRDVTTYTAVTRVEAVDGEGRVAEATVHFPAWKREVNGEADSSLEGAHVRLRGVGAERKVEVASPSTRATDRARAWLEGEFGAVSLAREQERMEPFLPPTAVAEGDTWTPDLGRIRKALGDSVPFDPEKGEAKATLVALADGTATWTSEVTLGTKGLPAQGVTLPWTEGGTLEARVQVRRSLDPAGHETATEATTTWKGKADASGAVVDFGLVTVTKSETKAGGTIPPLPPAAPAAGATPAK
jgi:hypothetical protein